jgi:hypothetical protein
MLMLPNPKSQLPQTILTRSLLFRIPPLLPLPRLYLICRTGWLEIQTRPLALLDSMAQVAPILRVAVILQVFPARGIWKSVLEAHAPDARFRVRAHTHCKSGLSNGILVPFQGDIWICFLLTDPVDCVFSVEAGSDGAAERFNSRDGRLRSAGHDDVDGSCQSGSTTGEEFDAILYAMYGACCGELAESDGFRRINSALIDPVLDAVEVDG